jgi:hypothetical protein
MFAASLRGGWGGVFNIFPSKGFGLDFFKVVVGRRIGRRRSSNNRGRRRAWESAGWWECA